MWMVRLFQRQESSTPGTSTMPCACAAVSASASPAMVSWSVRERWVTPRPAARSTSAAGDSAPSEAVLWQCRSMHKCGSCGIVTKYPESSDNWRHAMASQCTSQPLRDTTADYLPDYLVCESHCGELNVLRDYQ